MAFCLFGSGKSLFSPATLLSFGPSVCSQAAIKAQQQTGAPAREECNKYDLTAALPIFDWPIIMIGRGGLLLVVPTYLALQSRFSFMGGVAKKVNN